MHRILIVDEDEHLLWALEKNLFPERDDLRVVTATDGEAGMEILKGGGIDLLVSDIKMPGKVDGFQLILRAKEIAPEARVVIMTTFGSGRIESFADRMGITHYIEKPFNISELRNMALGLFDEKEGFQGVLSDLELTDIIQMLCLAKRSTLLHLKHRDHRGKIVFDNGELVHAEFDHLEGPIAVYRMLALRQGDIFMESDAEYDTRTIRMGWQDLLLEAVRLDDEDRLAQATRAREEGSEDNIPFASFRASDSSEIPLKEALDEPAEPVESAPAESAPEEWHEPSVADEAETSDGWTDDDDDYPPPSHTDRLSGDSFFTEQELEEIGMASSAAIEESGGFAAVTDSPDRQETGQLAGLSERREHPWRQPSPGGQVAPSVSPAMVAVDLPEDDYAGAALAAREFSTPILGSSDISMDRVPRGEFPPDTLAADGGQIIATPAAAHVEEIVSPEPAVSSEASVADVDAGADANGSDFVGPGVAVLSELEDFVTECARLRATGIIGPGLRPETSFVETSHAGSREPGAVSGGILEVVSSAHRVANSLDATRGAHAIQLTFEDAYVVIRRLGVSGHFHFAVVEREASLGVVLVVMRQFAQRLESAVARSGQSNAANPTAAQ